MFFFNLILFFALGFIRLPGVVSTVLSPVGACGLTRTISAYAIPAWDGDAIVCSLWLWALPFKKRSPAAPLVVGIDFKFYDMPIYIYMFMYRQD